jgi:hypothetical protein
LLAAHFPTYDSTAFAMLPERSDGMETTFMAFQSYGSSLPQSKQTTYVPVSDVAAERWPRRMLLGKV